MRSASRRRRRPDSAGLTDVRLAPEARAGALYRTAARDGVSRALHLCGENIAEAAIPPGLQVERRAVYGADPQPLVAEAEAALLRGEVDLTLLYSARTAEQFAAETRRLGRPRPRLHIALLGPPPADFPADWGSIRVAASPQEDALFAAAGLLCHKGARS